MHRNSQTCLEQTDQESRDKHSKETTQQEGRYRRKMRIETKNRVCSGTMISGARAAQRISQKKGKSSRARTGGNGVDSRKKELMNEPAETNKDREADD